MRLLAGGAECGYRTPFFGAVLSQLKLPTVEITNVKPTNTEGPLYVFMLKLTVQKTQNRFSSLRNPFCYFYTVPS